MKTAQTNEFHPKPDQEFFLRLQGSRLRSKHAAQCAHPSRRGARGHRIGLANLGADDWLWLLSAIALVWFAETMNTAFEFLCDVVQPEFHTSVGRAKDIAAGAVLITAIYAVVVGLLVLVPALT